MSVGQGSSLVSGLALEELQLCWTCWQKKHWKMQAKAVVVVEWVCGTLHTDTTGENQTCRGGQGKEETWWETCFMLPIFRAHDLDCISNISTAHSIKQSFDYNNLLCDYNRMLLTTNKAAWWCNLILWCIKQTLVYVEPHNMFHLFPNYFTIHGLWEEQVCSVPRDTMRLLR